ncbi:MAG TPA: hypothetical protein DGG95_13250 [Cytophagales bacterium]|jgi:uncharacterized protein|nr:hypothetical protein [Cytophagales bacterium]
MFVTALIIGFAGSWHCVGMCSPLAMAVSNLTSSNLLNRFIYNVGRIGTYALLGAIVSLVGYTFPLIQYQNLLSLLIGVVLLMVGVGGISRIKIPFFTTQLAKFSGVLKKLFAHFLKKKNPLSVFLLGTCNGFLPCGLTFLALSYCITFNTPVDGIYFMLLFGVGTLPAMIGLSSLLLKGALKINLSVQQLTVILFILSGTLLIGRVLLVHLPHAHSLTEGMMDIVVCRN